MKTQHIKTMGYNKISSKRHVFNNEFPHKRNSERSQRNSLLLYLRNWAKRPHQTPNRQKERLKNLSTNKSHKDSKNNIKKETNRWFSKKKNEIDTIIYTKEMEGVSNLQHQRMKIEICLIPQKYRRLGKTNAIVLFIF